jgi:predicted secreted hydrolase
VNVTGQAWMDHEFTSFKPKRTTRGWDWFAIQPDSGYDVMLYQIHRTDGPVSKDCIGTLIDPEGNTSSIVKPWY